MSKPFRFGKTSRFNLYGKVHGLGVKPELILLCETVLSKTPRDFMIVDGVRTLEEQKRNMAKGFSKTMKSKHLLGRAIDFAPVIKSGVPDWVDLKGFQIIGELFEKCAKDVGLKITWGGRWKWKDWGHIQIDA